MSQWLKLLNYGRTSRMTCSASYFNANQEMFVFHVEIILRQLQMNCFLEYCWNMHAPPDCVSVYASNCKCNMIFIFCLSVSICDWMDQLHNSSSWAPPRVQINVHSPINRAKSLPFAKKKFLFWKHSVNQFTWTHAIRWQLYARAIRQIQPTHFNNFVFVSCICCIHLFCAVACFVFIFVFFLNFYACVYCK